jgi:hypothetical protein
MQFIKQIKSFFDNNTNVGCVSLLVLLLSDALFVFSEVVNPAIMVTLSIVCAIAGFSGLIYVVTSDKIKEIRAEKARQARINRGR